MRTLAILNQVRTKNEIIGLGKETKFSRNNKIKIGGYLYFFFPVIACTIQYTMLEFKPTTTQL
jgi:hypothetical protein